jgi:dCMP deaminase
MCYCMITMRKDKADKFFQLAEFQANLFSKDPNTKVGALFLAPGSYQIVSQGFNGMPRGIDETIASRWERPVKYFRVAHAEANAVANACRHGAPLENTIAIVTLFPCATCAKLMIQSGIQYLVTREPDMSCPRWGEEFKYSLEMLQEAGVEIMYVGVTLLNPNTMESHSTA